MITIQTFLNCEKVEFCHKIFVCIKLWFDSFPSVMSLQTLKEINLEAKSLMGDIADLNNYDNCGRLGLSNYVVQIAL